MSYLDRIREANRCDLSGFRPFCIDAERVGFIRHRFAERLRDWPAVFAVETGQVLLSAELRRADLDQRSAAVAEVLDRLRAEGEFGGHWWDERFAVDAGYGRPTRLLLERAALQHFGISGYGVHLNGYVRDADGLRMWVGKRSRFKASGPGKLDQLVAGGQPAGIGLRDNMLKECFEEAGMDAATAGRMVAVGAVSYCLETEAGLRPDVIFNFDLELPADFTPVNTDGEVETFYLWPIEQVAERVRDGDTFKFNCSLVIIDFLIRHGVIEPTHPDYLALQSGLRQRELILANAA